MSDQTDDAPLEDEADVPSDSMAATATGTAHDATVRVEENE